MARLLLVLVMATGALARPQDCELFGDCPSTTASPPAGGFDDELFGPEPAGDCDEIFGDCPPAAPQPAEDCDEIFGNCLRTTADEDAEDIFEAEDIFDGDSNGFEETHEDLCFESVNEINDFEGDNG
jgi:hypothetical protein